MSRSSSLPQKITVSHLAVIIVGDEQVANSVDALEPQILALVSVKVPHVSGAETLDEVLLNPASRRYHHVDHLMLDKEANYLPLSA